MNKLWTKQKLFLFCLALAVLIFVPFLVLLFCSYPYADDFSFGTTLREYGYWGAVKYSYLHLNGRYSGAVFQYLLNHSLLSSSLLAYRLSLLGIFVASFGALYLLFKKIWSSHRETFYVWIGFSLMYLYNYPSISEGFLWLVVASAYTIGNLVFVLCLRSMWDWKKSSLLGAAVATFVLPGLSETYILVMPTVLVFCLSIKYWNQKILDNGLLLLLLLALIGASIAIFSSGNKERMVYEFGNQVRIGFVACGIGTIKFSILLIAKWFNSPLPIVSVLYVPLGLVLYRRHSDFFTRYKVAPVLALVLCVALVMESIFPSFWVYGKSPFPRSLNISYHLFLLSWLFFLQTLIVRYQALNLGISPRILLVLSFSLLFYLKNSDTTQNNIGTTYSDLLSQKAFDLGKYWDKIIADLHQNKEVDIRYNPNRPLTLFHGQIDTFATSQCNQWMARFYKQKYIKALK